MVVVQKGRQIESGDDDARDKMNKYDMTKINNARATNASNKIESSRLMGRDDDEMRKIHFNVR